MPVKLRRARVEDGTAIIELANALNRYEGKAPTPLTEEGLARHMFGRRRILSCVLTELDGALVGYAAFQPSFDMETGSSGLYMSDLFVREEARRRGVGRALMQWLAREALRRGGAWLGWGVMKSNAEAEAFYRAVGGGPVEVEIYSVACERVLGSTSAAPLIPDGVTAGGCA
jgi:ribosomal protein S18 acetylase RimI-like enzyme